LIDEERRPYIHASIATGTIGCLLFFVQWIVSQKDHSGELEVEGMIGFFGAILVGTLMLVFMNMSGFKAK
jgi:uncharacterized membrane protein